MIVALLLVIILILLFGAGVVKGWIANIVGLGCGGLAILVALLWLGSFFGENGFASIMWTIFGILMVLALIGLAVDPNKQVPPVAQSAPPPPPPSPREHQAPVPKPPSPPQQKARERSREKVWGWYAADIALRFSPEARAQAHELYEKDDVLGLDRLCREEVARLTREKE